MNPWFNKDLKPPRVKAEDPPAPEGGADDNITQPPPPPSGPAPPPSGESPPPSGEAPPPPPPSAPEAPVGVDETEEVESPEPTGGTEVRQGQWDVPQPSPVEALAASSFGAEDPEGGRTTSRLVLADAMEEAGVGDPTLLRQTTKAAEAASAALAKSTPRERRSDPVLQFYEVVDTNIPREARPPFFLQAITALLGRPLGTSDRALSDIPWPEGWNERRFVDTLANYSFAIEQTAYGLEAGLQDIDHDAAEAAHIIQAIHDDLEPQQYGAFLELRPYEELEPGGYDFEAEGLPPELPLEEIEELSRNFWRLDSQLTSAAILVKSMRFLVPVRQLVGGLDTTIFPRGDSVRPTNPKYGPVAALHSLLLDYDRFNNRPLFTIQYLPPYAEAYGAALRGRSQTGKSYKPRRSGGKGLPGPKLRLPKVRYSKTLRRLAQ